VPLLFLTARVDDIDQITGLGDGRRRLRHQALQPARRSGAGTCTSCGVQGAKHPAEQTVMYRVGRTLRSIPETHIVTLNGERVELTPSEFTLLADPHRADLKARLHPHGTTRHCARGGLCRLRTHH
jgi:DNA-binding response OmpR family regulator